MSALGRIAATLPVVSFVLIEVGKSTACRGELGGWQGGCVFWWAECVFAVFVCLCRRGKVDAFGKTSYQGQEKVGESVLCAGIAAGHGIIANVRGGSHWVLLVSAS